jgi:small subunit ribosomal protein S20
MANHKSAEKAQRRSLKRAARNRSIKSKVKTFITRFKNALHTKDLDAATAAFRNAESELMRSVSKGVYHLNTAARKTSRLCHMLKQLEATPK